jgi:subtilisin
MKTKGKPILVSLLVILGLLLATSIVGAASPTQAGPPVNPGPPAGVGPATHIVLFHDWVDPEAASADLAQSQGLTREFVYRYALKGASFIIPPGREAAVRSDPRVASIERNQIATVFAQTIPTGVDRIDAEGAGAGNPVDVDIAIIDTGVDATHPDLNVVGRTDCASGSFLSSKCTDGSGDDGYGHGTHVAGIAAAKNNLIGVRGVAPGARLWSVRVLGNNGSGYYSWIIAGVDWVTARAGTIEVANMSIGGPPSSSLDTAINNSVKAGVTYVVAAGNDSADASNYSPASNPNVITVSAIVDTDGKGGELGGSTGYGADDTFASFSNYGAPVDLAAPGVNIYSTYKGGSYTTMSGTSMASPHVAGAAALYKAANPGASPAQVKSGLLSSAKAQADSGYGFTGDPDSYHELLVYVGAGSVTPPPTNTSPTISNITNQSTNEDTATSAIAFTVGDAETPNSLTVSGSSSNTTLVPNGNIVFVGSLTDRTVTVTPAANANGSATITVTVTDPVGATATDTFVLTVNPANQVTVSSVSKSSVKGGGTYTLIITGNGFALGAVVTFENGSGPAPTVIGSPTVSIPTTITATVGTSKTPKTRTWDLRVTNPDGTSGVLVGGLTITR